LWGALCWWIECFSLLESGTEEREIERGERERGRGERKRERGRERRKDESCCAVLFALL
jgi:hypothetical protein